MHEACAAGGVLIDKTLGHLLADSLHNQQYHGVGGLPLTRLMYWGPSSREHAAYGGRDTNGCGDVFVGGFLSRLVATGGVGAAGGDSDGDSR